MQNFVPCTPCKRRPRNQSSRLQRGKRNLVPFGHRPRFFQTRLWDASSAALTLATSFLLFPFKRHISDRFLPQRHVHLNRSNRNTSKQTSASDFYLRGTASTQEAHRGQDDGDGHGSNGEKHHTLLDDGEPLHLHHPRSTATCGIAHSLTHPEPEACTDCPKECHALLVPGVSGFTHQLQASFH